MTNKEIELMGKGFVHMDGFTRKDWADQKAAEYRQLGHETTITSEKIGRVSWFTVWVRWKEVRV